MPLVFKGRRNILRSANKSKREHFTENSINQDDFEKSAVEAENEKKELEARNNRLNPPVTRGSDESRDDFEKRVVDAEKEKKELEARNIRLNSPLTRGSDESRNNFEIRLSSEEEKELEARNNRLNSPLTRGVNETRNDFEIRLSSEEEKELEARNNGLISRLTRGVNETRNNFEIRLSSAEEKEKQPKLSEKEVKMKAIDTENQGLKNLLVYVQQTINSILKEVGKIEGIDVKDPWCSGYFRRDTNTCCGSYDADYCKYKHPAVGMANILFVGIIVLMLGAITYRFYKMIRDIF